MHERSYHLVIFHLLAELEQGSTENCLWVLSDYFYRLSKIGTCKRLAIFALLPTEVGSQDNNELMVYPSFRFCLRDIVSFHYQLKGILSLLCLVISDHTQISMYPHACGLDPCSLLEVVICLIYLSMLFFNDSNVYHASIVIWI